VPAEHASNTSRNRAFWDELCGSTHAAELGIQGDSPDDLGRFDDYFFSYYPYLRDYLDRIQVRGKRILEVGLGYGTVGQYLKQEGAEYLGMDIASGPAAMMAHRHRLLGADPTALVGDALRMPFANETFDAVVAIGCLHHTGDFPRAIEEVHRVLRPGGQALVMVYHRFSYYQWLRWPSRTFSALLGLSSPGSAEQQRAQADANTKGEAAPVTEFFSVGEVRRIFAAFSAVECHRENCYDHGVLARLGLDRQSLLPRIGRLGLDLYVVATKAAE
jgi:SAM-dependent methyltransferase